MPEIFVYNIIISERLLIATNTHLFVLLKLENNFENFKISMPYVSLVFSTNNVYYLDVREILRFPSKRKTGISPCEIKTFVLP